MQKSVRVVANQVRSAEHILSGALRLFDIEGRSVEIYVLDAQRTGMLLVVHNGKSYASNPKQPPSSFTPDGREVGRMHLGTAQLLMDASHVKEEIVYVQDVALDANGVLGFRVAIRFLKTTDGTEMFNEAEIEGFPLPEAVVQAAQ